MSLTNNVAYVDRSSANQGDSGIHIPPSYETIRDPATGSAADRHYEVLEPTPGEPRHGLPTSPVPTNTVAPHYELDEPTPPGNPPQARDYEVPVNERSSSQQQTGGHDEYARLGHQ